MWDQTWIIKLHDDNHLTIENKKLWTQSFTQNSTDYLPYRNKNKMIGLLLYM